MVPVQVRRMTRPTVNDIAREAGVSLATVRTLLQRAFDETGTHTQAELVRLMLAHRLPAGPPSGG